VVAGPRAALTSKHGTDMDTVIVWPMLAQVGITAAVWLRMYFVRVAEMRERRIHPQTIAMSQAKSELLQKTNVADNFNNLFEVPVLFFAACLTVAALDIESAPALVLAWLFVALRALHSLIQTTYNKVMHRFPVYVASTLAVFAMWSVIGIELL